ncbi:leucyl aminopeptidase family protein [Methylotenera sp.]|uniref:M17 family metallopeptidase n=1 Tax=Methylotenera sp. TaxID=2051956 RepID=UPI0027337207|nr:leucyl aminopeptidase family protein [Methylotenera sp.]MDP3775940.1 leucyl aminopeptidase family protein [Methylotenera sp.]
MSAKLRQNAAIANENTLKDSKHMLFVLSSIDDKNIPFKDNLDTKLKRIKSKLNDLNKTPLVLDLPNGGIASYVILDSQLNMFQRHTLLRKAIKPIIAEQAEKIDICVFGEETVKEAHACAAYYVATVNASELPSRKKEHKQHILKSVTIHGYKAAHDYTYVNARVAGNTLCRELTVTPPNELTPTLYRQKIAKLALDNGWDHKEYDINSLKKLGAGTFIAVAQGSDQQDAAIVHLTYDPANAKKHIAIVGKGICFDTGGHNLKPAKYMQGMHEDMNGSAVGLGILLAVTEMQLPIKLDCWLAIAQNHIGPNAFKQNDVITALNGMTIEVVHTDAEGRMVLADTLTLASRKNPDLIIDFATLTGSMITALSNRMSGVITNRPELINMITNAGMIAGERVVSFPYDDDFDSELDSDIADIKQCTLDGEADHIHAARFLGKFIENNTPWIHTDLSSANRKGGLGAVESDTNGFGVGFGLALIKHLMN